MKLLIACEESGTVRDALIAAGHDALSCDLLPSRRPGPHYQGDVLDILNDGWDGMIAFPPCTYLANSGIRWLYNPDGTRNEPRWEEMRKAAEFFNMLLNANIPLIALENPRQHKYARMLIRKPDMVIQPYYFGHGETKATCLWLKSLPPLMSTYIHTGREQRIWKMPPGPNRQRERSVTYSGIAEAFASQWFTPKLAAAAAPHSD